MFSDYTKTKQPTVLIFFGLKSIYISCGYTHLGFGAFRRVNGLGWVQLRFHVTLGDAVTQKKTPLGEKYNYIYACR